jgi:competence protein ComGC
MRLVSAKERASWAVTLIELLAIMLIVVLFAALVVPAMRRPKERAATIQCISNLKQIGVGFKVWALDHSNQFPARLSSTLGGSQENAGEAFRHFQILSNELGSPLVVLCPADTRGPAKDFGPSFSNSNVSYFVGLEATDDVPQMWLAGDRNITNGTPQKNGILTLTTNSVVGWTHEMHNLVGHVLLADGSVQQVNRSRLNQTLRFSGGTNRLAMP